MVVVIIKHHWYLQCIETFIQLLHLPPPPLGYWGGNVFGRCFARSRWSVRLWVRLFMHQNVSIYFKWKTQCYIFRGGPGVWSLCFGLQIFLLFICFITAYAGVWVGRCLTTVAVAQACNALPSSVRTSPTYLAFRRQLKTLLFKASFEDRTLLRYLFVAQR